jgi:hypothetical protein
MAYASIEIRAAEVIAAPGTTELAAALFQVCGTIWAKAQVIDGHDAAWKDALMWLACWL